MHVFQRTLKTNATAVGVGLHTGAKVLLTVKPASANQGIVFVRTDVSPPISIPARAEHVGDTRLASGIELAGVANAKVSTVEHFMAAMAALGIDNAIVEVKGPEMPILDGSSAPFMLLLKEAGIIDLPEKKTFFKIKSTVRVEHTDKQGTKFAELSPVADGRSYVMDFTIAFEHPSLDDTNQRVVCTISEDSFAEDIARARTFCFTKDVEMMRANQLALGGNLSNAIVLDPYKILNQGGLRFADELARHKLLDALGDLYLLGAPIIGQYTALKSGHALNNQLARALLAKPEAFERVTLK